MGSDLLKYDLQPCFGTLEEPKVMLPVVLRFYFLISNSKQSNQWKIKLNICFYRMSMNKSWISLVCPKKIITELTLKCKNNTTL